MKKTLSIVAVLAILFSSALVYAETGTGRFGSDMRIEKIRQETRSLEDSRKGDEGKIRDPRTFNVACVQASVEKRESSLITALDAKATVLKTALTDRKSGLVAAWALPTVQERQAARKTAWEKYKTTIKLARKTSIETRRATWETFKTDMKACGGATNGVTESESRDDLSTEL